MTVSISPVIIGCLFKYGDYRRNRKKRRKAEDREEAAREGHLGTYVLGEIAPGKPQGCGSCTKLETLGKKRSREERAPAPCRDLS